jgi:hypothetical protein
MTTGPDVIHLSDLEGPYPPEKWPGWVRGLSWAYTLWQYPPNQSAVAKCKYCDHAIRFPTFPDGEDQANGVLWMITHNYRHIVMGDVDPDDLGEELPIP